jgi:hypothetical protein
VQVALLPIVLELLEEFARRAAAQEKKQYPIDTLWRSAQQYWSEWLSARWDVLRPHMPVELPENAARPVFIKWLQVCTPELQGSQQVAAMKEIVGHARALQAPLNPAPAADGALAELLESMTNAVKRKAMDQSFSGDVWPIVESEMRQQIARRCVGGSDAEEGNDEEEEEEGEEEDQQPAGRAAKASAQSRNTREETRRRKKNKAKVPDHPGMVQLAKFLPRFVELLKSGATEEELVEECSRSVMERDRAEAALLGAGRWLLNNEDNQEAEVQQKRLRMTRVLNESRQMIDTYTDLQRALQNGDRSRYRALAKN